MPRSSIGQINQNIRNPPSPKFGNSYASPSQQMDRQFLLDQIIINCQKAQSPLGPRKSCNESKNTTLKTQFYQQKQKENIRNYGSPYLNQKADTGKMQSFQYQAAYLGRPSFQSQKQYQANFYNNFNLNSVQRHKGQSEYSPKPFKALNSPTNKFRPSLQFKKPKIYPDNDLNQQERFQEIRPIQIKTNFRIDQQKIRKHLQQERANHIQHCKHQERKLRLYYIQLQNKICEMRNKELRMLAEYQSTKLKQYDQCIKIAGSMFQQQNQTIRPTQQYHTKMEQINKSHILRVNQQKKPEIKGCLVNGVSGIYFSFQQKIF